MKYLYLISALLTLLASCGEDNNEDIRAKIQSELNFLLGSFNIIERDESKR